MFETIESWPEKQNTIQKRFFRTGLYTFFYIHPIEKLPDGSVKVSWKYEFADMGMFNNINKSYLIRKLPDNSCQIQNLLKPKCRLITVFTKGQLLSRVFDHYTSYLKAFYSSMGMDGSDEEKTSRTPSSDEEPSTNGEDGSGHLVRAQDHDNGGISVPTPPHDIAAR
jgi:hypothetical protein